MKGYKDIFTPELIGGKFFLKTIYLRAFFISLTTAIFGVVFIKLQGQVLSLQEIAILGQVLSTAVFFVPMLGRLRLKLLCLLGSLTEVVIFIVPLVYVLGLIESKTFLYLYTFVEIIAILVYDNLISVFQNYIQAKTRPNTAEHRQRGMRFVSAAGALCGSISVVILSGISDSLTHILYLLLIATGVCNVVIVVTNRKLLRYAFDDNKYPVVRKLEK